MFFWKKTKESSSSSAGWSKRSKELLLLLAGIILTASAIMLARQRIAAAERAVHRQISPVEIVVPSVPIQAGETFSENNLAKKAIPATGTSSRNVPAADFELLLGARAKGNLTAGEPILWTDVDEPFDADRFSQTIPSGRRAFTLDVNATSSFAGLIRSGDVVDLLCGRGTGDSTQRWIHGVPVISVDRSYGKSPSKEEAREISTITLSVTPEEGRLIAVAAREGGILWFLRNPDEKGKSSGEAGQKRKESPGKVEIWKAGMQESPSALPIGEPG